MFEPLRYLDWMVDRTDVEHDLGGSVLGGAGSYDGRSVMPEPVAALPEPPADVEVREQVADEYGVPPGRVEVTAGASHANVLAAMVAVTAARRRGEEPRVLIETPGYEPLVETPRGLGATVDRVPRTDRGSGGDPAALAGAVGAAITDETALVTLTNRHNPSGRLLERAAVRRVAERAREHDALLLVDEVYAPFTVGDDVREGPGTAFGGPTAAGLPNTVVTQSFTKFFGIEAVRIGWLIAPDDGTADRVRTAANHLPVTCPVAFPQARRILHGADELARGQRELLEHNHGLLVEFAARESVRGRVPPGSAHALLGHADPGVDGDDVAAAAQEAGVLVVPGRFFGTPDRVRICLGGPAGEMRKGIDRLERVFDRL